MLNFLKTILGIRQAEYCSLETIVDRTSSFLVPQLGMMNKIDGNKFGFITMHSIAYMLNVARELGGRVIEDDELENFFVGVLGEEYRRMIEHRLKNIRDPLNDTEKFINMIKSTREIAREDVRKGADGSSKFLVKIAEDHAQWQKKVAAMN